MVRDADSPVTWRDISELQQRVSSLETSVRVLTTRLERIEGILMTIQGNVIEKAYIERELTWFKSLAKRMIIILLSAIASATGSILILLFQRLL
ncbi:MAG: hypothetical protein QXP81_09890 [Nitrososphaerota archaeon]